MKIRLEVKCIIDRKLVSVLTWILFYVNLAVILEINTFKIAHDDVKPKQ